MTYYQLPEIKQQHWNTLADAKLQKQQLESNSLNLLKNRIDVENAMMNQGINQGKMNVLSGGLQGQQAAIAAGQRQQVMQQELAKEQALKSASDTLASLKKAMGVEGVKKNWDAIKGINPVFAKLDPNNITNNGYVVKDESGQVVGQWVQNPEGGTPHFVQAKQPVSSDAALMQGYKEQFIAKGMNPGQAGFAAAKQVQSDKIAARRQEIVLRNENRPAPRGRASSGGAMGSGPTGKAAAGGIFSTMPEEDKEVLYQEKYRTGKDPRFYGDKKSAGEFQKGFAGWARGHGITGSDVASAQAKFKADSSSYASLKKNFDMTNQALMQAQETGQLLRQASDNFQRGNYPLPNAIIAWRDKQLGTKTQQADIAKFNLALLAHSREYLRVTTGAARSARELSEGAQKMADKLLSSSDSWSTLNAKIDQTHKEMDAVKQTYLNALKEREGSFYEIPGKTQGDIKPTDEKKGEDPLGIR